MLSVSGPMPDANPHNPDDPPPKKGPEDSDERTIKMDDTKGGGARPGSAGEFRIHTTDHGESRPPSGATVPDGEQTDGTIEMPPTGTRPEGEDAVPPEVLAAMRDPLKNLNHYVLVTQVGAGGMGAVWKAWDRKLARWVAVKFLTAAVDQNVRRFHREARVAAKLRHRNIVAVYEVNESGGRHFIAMEYVDGTGIDKAGLPLEDLLKAFVVVCRAIDDAHGEGVIHRDIKPANIMYSHKGVPYVTDFGLAKMLQAESSISVSGAVMGTPAYMAPEQARGEIHDVDRQSDVYSLGATLYHLLTGEAPFKADNVTSLLLKVCTEDPAPPRRLRQDLPEPVQAVVLKAMEKEKGRRYATAAELAEDLDRYLKGGVVEARSPSSFARVLRKIRRNPWPAMVVLLLIAGGVLTAVLMTREKNGGPRPSDSNGTRNPTPDEIRRQEEEDWKRKMDGLRSRLEYAGFSGADPDAVEEAGTLLDATPDGLEEEAANRFRDLVTELPASIWPRRDWLRRADEARRILDWCAMVRGIIEGREGPLEAVRTRLGGAEQMFAPVATYRGTVTLKIYAFNARLKSLRVGARWIVRDGNLEGDASIVGESLDTPLVIEDLDIGEYTITLTGGSGDRELTIDGTDLRNGGTYVFSGSLDKPDSFRLRSP